MSNVLQFNNFKFVFCVELIIEHNQLLAQMKHTEGQMLRIARERDALEKECALLRISQKDCKIREDIAYAKIREALNVAEIAISEKNEALKREKDIQGDVFHLSFFVFVLL